MTDAQKPWLTVIGIGDDGLDGLPEKTRALIASAEILVGGDRHQEMVPDFAGERLTWKNGMAETAEDLRKSKGRRVVVLASGDPMFFGVGSTLTRFFDAREMTVIPFPGTFSMACARMVWSMPDTELITLHGRPLDSLNLVIAPGVRTVILSWDGETPSRVAALLRERGFGPSRMTVFEHMGGVRENRRTGTAADWAGDICADLNAIAVEFIAGPDAEPLSRAPGLPDDAYENDGQLTKRAVRAATLSALAPLPGQTLWDVGAGCGSVAIEWMRVHHSCKAVAIEESAERAAMIERNAANLGVPRLTIVQGKAPDALSGLDAPDAVFVGGGVSEPDMLETCWAALIPGGRMVANAVTVEGEQRLHDFQKVHGGEMLRIGLERMAPIGGHSGWQAARTVTQWTGIKR
ncbi:MAG: precorrin-6y C5,15-methyltransferase (decarboxylating) subunit CbiE [Rhodospirillales bacterium]|nr:precorrin-6y C5,15-methyltransferase (decarboxylating) subunit CbiE [Rhodospirillales bacterium]